MPGNDDPPVATPQGSSIVTILGKYRTKVGVWVRMQDRLVTRSRGAIGRLGGSSRGGPGALEKTIFVSTSNAISNKHDGFNPVRPEREVVLP